MCSLPLPVQSLNSARGTTNVPRALFASSLGEADGSIVRLFVDGPAMLEFDS
jgi:hypothetical protein